MISFLKILLVALLAWMIYVVVSTSLQSSLFEQWDFLGSIPWMRATLWDFYANIFLIFLWLIYKERNILLIIMWGILFFCLGSIATIGYVLIQLFSLKDGEGLYHVLTKRRNA
jgi:hypothetical protein